MVCFATLQLWQPECRRCCCGSRAMQEHCGAAGPFAKAALGLQDVDRRCSFAVTSVRLRAVSGAAASQVPADSAEAAAGCGEGRLTLSPGKGRCSWGCVEAMVLWLPLLPTCSSGPGTKAPEPRGGGGGQQRSLADAVTQQGVPPGSPPGPGLCSVRALEGPRGQCLPFLNAKEDLLSSLPCGGRSLPLSAFLARSGLF